MPPIKNYINSPHLEVIKLISQHYLFPSKQKENEMISGVLMEIAAVPKIIFFFFKAKKYEGFMQINMT